MKVVILAGGYGTRLAEETALRPKPMVEIGGQPILWHIMSIYARHGFNDFLIACGYKGEVIKEYFHNYRIRHNDWTIELAEGTVRTVLSHVCDWRVGLVDTGLNTATGGRIKRLEAWLDGQPFMVTYGDGVADVDVGALAEFHRAHGRLATVTAVRPPARFGSLEFDGDAVSQFSEKPQAGEGWINGGFFVFQPQVLDYLAGDHEPLERGPLERLSAERQLMAFRHRGFWQPMDTLRDKQYLESLWESGKASWKPKEETRVIGDVLPAKESLPYRPHGLQGSLAGDLAEDAGGERQRLRASA
ncbi:MAG TPA: glucose-1-phosphate cytidylyltransferase [Pirellulales bacterium]|nr:glucose-1-phosphate cytidylyltransferase [Pirellulales bacterium]